MWRALYAAASYQRPWGKYVIAVNEDIDPDNGDAVFWAMSYRADPEHDNHLDFGDSILNSTWLSVLVSLLDWLWRASHV